MFNYAFLKTLNILYLQSDISLNTYFSNILSKKFKNIISVKNFQEAKESINKNNNLNIDIIICEIEINDSFALGFLEDIKEEIPFILITKKIEINELLQAIQHNASDYLEKPINAKDLLFSVQNICQHKYQKKMKNENFKDTKDIKEVMNQIALVSKTNTKGEITFVNDYFCEVSGYSKEELIGLTHDVIKAEGSCDLVYEKLWEVVTSGMIWEGKLKKISKNKEDFYIYLTIIPIFKNKTKVIKEYMWISFLATKDELEQKEFKKKVAKNIHESRRINTEARDKINELINKISSYEYLDSLVINEIKRSSKFINQIKYSNKEVESIEIKLKDTSQKASIKIKKILSDEKETRIKKIQTDNDLNKLTEELDLKNASIEDLTKELNKQVKIIDRLMSSINNKEMELGL